MTCYIVTFETANQASQNRVTDRLQSYKIYCPINAHCWAIMSDKTAKEIAEHVGQGFLANERIFVIRSGTAAAWINGYGEKNSEWLKKNL